MDVDATVAPDERLFRRHVQAVGFAQGDADSRWRLLSIVWPVAVIWVAAASREGAPDGFAFRFELTGYTAAPPTAQLWDSEDNSPLPIPRWPRGAPGSRVERALNPGWRRDAVYLPCDRLALEGHGDWATQYPRYGWTPAKDITFFLQILYGLLHSAHYQGVRGA